MKFMWMILSIDNEHLYRQLNRILEDQKSLAEKINDSKQGYYEMGGYGEYNHFGKVELEPFQYKDGKEAGISILSSSGYMRKKERMIELANEILKFTDDLDESFINDYNEKLARKEQIENEEKKQDEKN